MLRTMFVFPKKYPFSEQNFQFSYREPIILKTAVTRLTPCQDESTDGLEKPWKFLQKVTAHDADLENFVR